MSSVYNHTRKRDKELENFSVASIAESQTKTHTDTSTPYGRIFRKSNIYASMIPNFLKQQEPVRGITVEDLRRLEIQSLPKFELDFYDVSSEKFRNRFAAVVEDIKRVYFLKENNPKEIENLQSLLNDIVRRNYQTIRISIKKWEITGEELFKLLNNRDINAKIVNTFMQHLKQVNRFLLKKNKNGLKFNFLSVELAELILVKGGLVRIQNLSLGQYDFHVFPIFHHYWKLVVYCPGKMSVKIYDLGRHSGDSMMYKENLENFVKYNEQSVSGIRFEDVGNKGGNLWNSGLYLCKLGQNLLMEVDENLENEDIGEFRLEILVILMRISQVNFIKG